MREKKDDVSDKIEADNGGRPSMADVAGLAGVSKAAVSKVIRNAYGVSPAMRQRVESAINTLGYRPRIAARAMRGASFTIGFEIPQLGNEFFIQVMEGAAAGLAGSGYQLIIAPAIGEMSGAQILNALVDRQVDGLIAISPQVTPAWLEKTGTQVPVVLVGRHDPSQSYDTLTNDDHRGATLAMDHLVALGHQRIAHLTLIEVPEVPAELLPHTIRQRTYESAMVERGLDVEVVRSGPLEPDAHRASIELLTSARRPTAIFAANDTLAIGALRARTELGLSATDVSIVGYDNIDIAANPMMSLTTVDQFGRESGEIAVHMLMERIRNERSEARHHMVTPELRIRNSTQPAGESR